MCSSATSRSWTPTRPQAAVRDLLALIAYQYPVLMEVDDSMTALRAVVEPLMEAGKARRQGAETFVVSRNLACATAARRGLTLRRCPGTGQVRSPTAAPCQILGVQPLAFRLGNGAAALRSAGIHQLPGSGPEREAGHAGIDSRLQRLPERCRFSVRIGVRQPV